MTKRFDAIKRRCEGTNPCDQTSKDRVWLVARLEEVLTMLAMAICDDAIHPKMEARMFKFLKNVGYKETGG